MLVPAIFKSFNCNYTLYKTDTSVKRTPDFFETDKTTPK